MRVRPLFCSRVHRSCFRVALAVILVLVSAGEAVRAARVVAASLGPRLPVTVDAAALAVTCVCANRDRVAPAVVLGVFGVGCALEARDTAGFARPTLAAALCIGGSAGVVGRRVEDALTVVPAHMPGACRAGQSSPQITQARDGQGGGGALGLGGSSCTYWL